METIENQGTNNEPKLKIAIIGGGISGLSAAYLLNQKHDITLFEKENKLGGHANTVEVKEEGKAIPIDTGFLVYNDVTYPNLVRLFKILNVKTEKSDMSFSVKSLQDDLEYCGSSLSQVFAQPSNFFRPWFLKMLYEIWKFNREGKKILKEGCYASWTLGRYLKEKGYSNQVSRYYVLPMGAAIWSTPADRMLEFPLQNFLRFLENHGMLGLNTHFQWRTVSGGSREYVRKISEPYSNKIVTGNPVKEVKRINNKVEIKLADGEIKIFDKVVFATHADITLKLLADATPEENRLLSLFPYQVNRAVLHGDARVMPTIPSAWASWNYELVDGGAGTLSSNPPYLHYYINKLQNMEKRGAKKDYFVTLNPDLSFNLREQSYSIDYEHPRFDFDSMSRQEEVDQLNGKLNSYFCGAWCGFGFHEDGLKSALRVCKHFGLSI